MQEEDGKGGTGGGESGPSLSDAGRRAAALRQQRQAAALRANLGRRKAQQRGRAASRPEKDPTDQG